MLKLVKKTGTLCLTIRKQNVRGVSSFRFEDLQIELTNKPAEKPDSGNLKFGNHISDHMLEIDYCGDRGWLTPRIRPVEPFQIHPAAKVLHYSIELFEGMKAYRCVDGRIRMFRPLENMARMSRTAQRSALPAFDQTELLRCIKKLVNLEQDWIPGEKNCSLYIRPTYIGTEPTLGVTMSRDAKLFVIAGPVGPYFPTGMKPVKLLADPQYVRAWPGGMGNYKAGSNYGPTIAIQGIANKLGCQQVLWLYGQDEQMTEVGTMNLFVYWVNKQGEEELITPPLESGLILPGVTRKSVLELARSWGEFKVSEQNITMPDFIQALNEGRVKEVFGAGTACIVCPVSDILYRGQELSINTMEDPDHLTQRLYTEINDIHYGRRPHEWMEEVDDLSSENAFRSSKTA